MDHAGNANLFSTATHHIQRAEHTAAFGSAPHRFGFMQANYRSLHANPTVLLDGDHDVFGDGSVVVLSTPGHTPGHQSLLVRLPKTGPLVLSGDIAHSRSNWEHHRMPASNFDREATMRSMARIERVLDENHATLVIQHDKADGATLQKPPKFLD